MKNFSPVFFFDLKTIPGEGSIVMPPSSSNNLSIFFMFFKYSSFETGFEFPVPSFPAFALTSSSNLAFN